MHASAKIKYDPTLLGLCDPKFGNQLIGVGIGKFQPTTYRSCYCNEYLAVRNRGLLDRGLDEEYAPFWEIAWQFEKSVNTRFARRIKAMPFKVWLARYPKSKQLLLIKAKERLASVFIFETIMVKKAFIKVENAVNMQESPSNWTDPTESIDTEEGVDGGDPRLIQGCLDEHQVRGGPWICAHSKVRSREWKGIIAGQRRNFYYTSGSDANHVGQVWQDAIDSAEAIAKWGQRQGYNWRVLTSEGDFNRMDAHTNVPSLIFSYKGYARAGAPKRVLGALRDQFQQRGKTRHGVFYSISGTNASGGFDTSDGNTDRSKQMNDMAIQRMSIWFVFFLLGDDSAAQIVYDADKWTPEDFYKAQRVVIGALAGYSPEPLLLSDHRDVTFCSMRFWPAIVDGQETVVLGPKIGRVLAKTFYSTRLLSPKAAMEQVRGICLGMVNDVKHIPVLRVLIPRLLEITSDYKARALPHDHKFHASKQCLPSDRIWPFIEHVYQLPASQFHGAELLFRNHLHALPCIINDPTFDDICKVDVPRKSDEGRRTSQIPEGESGLFDCMVPEEILQFIATDETNNSISFPSELVASEMPDETITYAQEYQRPVFARPAAFSSFGAFAHLASLFFQRATSPAGSDYLMSCFQAPAFEEYLKRSFRVFYYGIPAVELLADFAEGGLVHGLLRTLPRMSHFAMSAMPEVVGVAVHAVFNNAAFALQYRDDPISNVVGWIVQSTLGLSWFLMGCPQPTFRNRGLWKLGLNFALLVPSVLMTMLPEAFSPLVMGSPPGPK